MMGLMADPTADRTADHDGPHGGQPADDVLWDPWSPEEVLARLGGTALTWCVTAGWAIDLFVGRRTRDHHDLEICVPRARWPALRAALPELDFLAAGDGRLWPADAPALERFFQTWGRDARGTFRLDVFRDPHDGDTWICRRDPTIRRPYATLIETTPSGVPFMAPEVTLLFKAKHDRDKDRHDLRVALPLLDAARVGWLRTALARVHPGHPWSALLDVDR